MKKISRGKYEIFTTKEDAIHKFMQMEGICREEISGENQIQFYCSKKGKIVISNPPIIRQIYIDNDISTILFAKVIEQDNKTYVTYYTSFIKSANTLKSFSLAMKLIVAIAGIISAVVQKNKTISLLLLILCLVYVASRLFVNAKEKSNAPKDSEIMIKELENRINAVNQWDK